MAKRRASGEGNIRKRSDGRWEGRYVAGHHPDTGKPIHKNVLGKTQAEVKEKLKRAIEESKGLYIVKAGQYTFGQWMDVWFENYAELQVRPSSHQTYKGYIKNHIKPNIGDIPLALQNGVDNKTVSGMLGHFSAGFTLDTYAHVTTAAQKDAANSMGNVLAGTTQNG